jgi:hypothetical protein
MSSFIKIRPVGAELLHADGQTDMTKLTVAFFAILRTRLKTMMTISGTPQYLTADISAHPNY